MYDTEAVICASPFEEKVNSRNRNSEKRVLISSSTRYKSSTDRHAKECFILDLNAEI